MDLATVIGLLLGFGCCVFGLVADGGQFGLFFNVPALVIVIGGTFASTMVHFSMKHVLGMAQIFKKTLLYKLPEENDLVQKMVNYAAINRRDGTLALQKELPHAGDPFLEMAMRMLIDGQKPEQIEQHLAMEVQYLKERHGDGKKMLEFMGAGCPAFGMVGTLIGLVQMFSHMESPEAIGKGMAAALVCTFYGAFVANLLFLPMAGKLGIRSKKEGLLREMIMEGVVGIAKGEGPINVRERMQAFICGKQREDIKPTLKAA
jgi:chemotaxis protein MotA